MAIKYTRLQEEVHAGFDAIDQGDISERNADDIAEAVLKAHQQG